MDMKVFSLGRMMAFRVPRDLATAVGVVIGDVLYPRIYRGKIVYFKEHEPGARSIMYRSKDLGLPVLGLPAEHARELQIEPGTRLALSIHQGCIRVEKV